MKITGSPLEASKFCRKAKKVVLVPTMGALHAGHAALIRRAKAMAGPGGLVAVSVFVNPTQFGPGEDFSRYPRTFAADAELCRGLGTGLAFHPRAEAMYPEGFSTSVQETALSHLLCGASRPGHFAGVCTVVAKLFNILEPDAAVFGMKDYQQLAIIRRMARDLQFAIRIVAVETVRETDGLAMSSRNKYLTAEERAQAPIIRRTLLRAAELARKGERGPRALKGWIAREIGKAPLARVDYVELVDPETLLPLGRSWGSAVIDRRYRGVAAVAVFFGRTRLIDNIRIE